jgi:periplasmic divalent cation tolerance protein
MDTLLVISTFPDAETARQIGTQLVQDQLAACVNLFPSPVESIYRWKGNIETATETLAFFKTTRATYPALERALAEAHPYDVPEILALPVAAGLPAYLAWVGENARPPEWRGLSPPDGAPHR